ncbi:hypothetical protein BKA82DRAFT_1001468 [Pisolithus tinctorius]|uniref:Uncharacterized protein n=1 Tax=Pisolithus tinctorius Marx 270 TaxID=870435 RepID=A0A0C3NRN2_PISTI|nr:hypothetical protein BKA82DRAFT_1001468 [Pisolithus tinctorius]KIO03525.1 hypothetical protein M404DRAFT_1001468 [Pisolithus tinctorius Marx 270]
MDCLRPLPTQTTFGLLMAAIGIKRTRSHQPSNVIPVCTLKDVGATLMGLDRIMATYGYGGKKQGCTDDTRSYHQPVVLCSGAGSISSLERQYLSTATSEEHYGYDSEDDSDMDEEDPTKRGRTSMDVPTALAPLPLPPVSYAIENDTLAGNRAHFPIAPSVPGDTSVSFSRHFGHRQSFNPSPTRCSFIPSSRRSVASEADLACRSPGSEYFIPQAEEFQWDFPDPFSAPTTNPPCTFAMARSARMNFGDNIAPHMNNANKFWEQLRFAKLSPPPPPPPSPSPLDYETESVSASEVEIPVARLSLGAVGGGAQLGSFQPRSIPSRPASPGDGNDTYATSSDEFSSLALLRADLEYVNAVLRVQEAYEAKEAIAEEFRERENRARLRSQSKRIAVLGEEAA